MYIVYTLIHRHQLNITRRIYIQFNTLKVGKGLLTKKSYNYNIY
jgi:hypothetical protein